MRFLNAQFSLKFEPKIRIRRNVNQIEDALSDYYGVPQILPIPDEFAADAPRIILSSKNGHSQISFSQISADMIANFDGDFIHNFMKTKKYTEERITLLKNLLLGMGIEQYYFCGIAYKFQIDTMGLSSIEYLKRLVQNDISESESVCDVAQRISTVHDDKFFINRQTSLYREYSANGSSIPDLFALSNNEIIADGVSVLLDVNDRHRYIQSGSSISVASLMHSVSKIYEIIEHQLDRWE